MPSFGEVWSIPVCTVGLVLILSLAGPLRGGCQDASCVRARVQRALLSACIQLVCGVCDEMSKGPCVFCHHLFVSLFCVAWMWLSFFIFLLPHLTHFLFHNVAMRSDLMSHRDSNQRPRERARCGGRTLFTSF